MSWLYGVAWMLLSLGEWEHRSVAMPSLSWASREVQSVPSPWPPQIRAFEQR
jgi:hypothetical protein